MIYYLSTYADGNITIKEALFVSVKGILIVMIILAVVAIMVQILSKIIRRIRKAAYARADKKAAKKAAEEAAWVKIEDEPETVTDEVELINTDEKTAAVIMAVVSKESEIPLERLKFNSIRLLESEEDAK